MYWFSRSRYPLHDTEKHTRKQSHTRSETAMCCAHDKEPCVCVCVCLRFLIFLIRCRAKWQHSKKGSGSCRYKKTYTKKQRNTFVRISHTQHTYIHKKHVKNRIKWMEKYLYSKTSIYGSLYVLSTF